MNFLDSYEVAGSATPVSNQPQQSLDEEINQVVGQLNRFWGGFRKQVSYSRHVPLICFGGNLAINVEPNCIRSSTKGFESGCLPGSEGVGQAYVGRFDATTKPFR